MSFCKFSNGYLTSGYTPVNNIFITSYMPFAKDEYTKVYLYGLYLCVNMQNVSVEEFSELVDLDIDTIESAMKYWEEQGLVAVVSTSPLEVSYLPIKDSPVKKYKPGKYEDFNAQLQNLYPDRMIAPGELMKYCDFIEETKIEPDALIMIANYCIDYKGLKVRYPYILTVASDWVNDGIKKVADVDARIKEYSLSDETMRQIAKTIGKKTAIEVEDKQLYTKWTKSWGFDLESILYAGTLQKNRGGFEKLDKTLDNFYRLGIFTIDEMKNYKANRDKLYDLAIAVNQRLGLYYENLDYIIETYITKWQGMGFDDETLIAIADICFKSSIKSYEGMNNKVVFFYKNGRITKHAIGEYLAELIDTDKDIKLIIESLGSSRLPNKSDRDYYSTWTTNWGFSQEVILYVAKTCATKSQSMAYLNNTLGRYFESKRFTIDEIKAVEDSFGTSKKESFEEREFTAEELNGLFGSFDKV